MALPPHDDEGLFHLGAGRARIPTAAAFEDGGASAGRLRTRFRNAIVVAQPAPTLPLLIGRSMSALRGD